MYNIVKFYKLLQTLIKLRRAEKINSIDYLACLHSIKGQALRAYRNNEINAEQYRQIVEKADELTHAEHRHCGNWY